ncbi:hypothetical protein KY289_026900 [Solanum tuberosum]|nr:hypothetical protein KY289_026900 [Solanum tuberosum]
MVEPEIGPTSRWLQHCFMYSPRTLSCNELIWLNSHMYHGLGQSTSNPASNVRKERRKQPDPPCVVCKGNDRVECYHCHGRGRTNFVDLEMLPRGEWPKWCKSCGGSGLGYCSRCLGTGEYRYIMGFHFMRRDDEPEASGRASNCGVMYQEEQA